MPKAANLRVLVVDDQRSMRALVRSSLAQLGCAQCLEAEDGDEALQRISTYMPDLVISDLNMPKLDGREALSAIKADPSLRSIPVIVLTTSKSEEDVFRSYDLGVNSFITKPVSFEGLVEVVRILGHYWFEIVELPSLK